MHEHGGRRVAGQADRTNADGVAQSAVDGGDVVLLDSGSGALMSDADFERKFGVSREDFEAEAGG